MGICCSCFKSGDDEEENAQELELQAQRAKKALSISAKMSAPSIRASALSVEGEGLALVGASLDQDAAYWEWHITTNGKSIVDGIHFGVSGKKDRTFYESPDSRMTDDKGPSQETGTQWMRAVEVGNGDVVGVAMQQSDLPMLQFTLNGETLHISSINRFKGVVYPAIYLPHKNNEDSLAASFVSSEGEFKYPSPGSKFGPILVARSIV